MLDPEDPANEFVIQYYQQLANQTQQQRLGVDQQTVGDLVEEELAQQKAAEEGLSVSEDELNEEIRTRIAADVGLSDRNTGNGSSQHGSCGHRHGRDFHSHARTD